MPKLVLLHTPRHWWTTIQLRDVLRRRYPGLTVTAREAAITGATLLYKPGDQLDLDEARQLSTALTARFGVTKDPRADRFRVDKVLVLSECPACRQQYARKEPAL